MQQVLIFLGIIGIKLIFSAAKETVKYDAAYSVEEELSRFNKNTLNSAERLYNMHHEKISSEQKQRFENTLKNL